MASFPPLPFWTPIHCRRERFWFARRPGALAARLLVVIQLPSGHFRREVTKGHVTPFANIDAGRLVQEPKRVGTCLPGLASLATDPLA